MLKYLYVYKNGENAMNEKENEMIENGNDLPEYQDDLSTAMSIDEINDLSESDIEVLMQKIDIELEEYEDIYMKGESLGKTYEEICEDGYNETEYNRLKELNKALYKNLKALRKMKKDNSMFSKIPVWGIIMSVVIALISTYPICPFLSTKIAVALEGLIDLIFTDYTAGCIVVICLYHALLLIIEGVSILLYYKSCKKNNEGYKGVKGFLILYCINIVLMIYPIIIVFKVI